MAQKEKRKKKKLQGISEFKGEDERRNQSYRMLRKAKGRLDLSRSLPAR